MERRRINSYEKRGICNWIAFKCKKICHLVFGGGVGLVLVWLFVWFGFVWFLFGFFWFLGFFVGCVCLGLFCFDFENLEKCASGNAHCFKNTSLEWIVNKVNNLRLSEAVPSCFTEKKIWYLLEITECTRSVSGKDYLIKLIAIW